MAGARAQTALSVKAAALAVAMFVTVAPGLIATVRAETPLQSSQSAPAQPAMSKDDKPSTPRANAPASSLPEAHLERASFADLPGWETDDHLAAFNTFIKSCDAAIRMAEKGSNRVVAQCRVPLGELAAACRAARTLVETRPDRGEDPKPLFYGGLFSHATPEEKERYLSGHLFTRLAAGAGARDEAAHLGAATRARLRQLRERIKTQTQS